jgi:hypothetical protein
LLLWSFASRFHHPFQVFWDWYWSKALHVTTSVQRVFYYLSAHYKWNLIFTTSYETNWWQLSLGWVGHHGWSLSWPSRIASTCTLETKMLQLESLPISVTK